MKTFFRYFGFEAVLFVIATALMFLALDSLAFSKKKPELDPSPTPISSVTPSPSPIADAGDLLVTYDPASGIEKSFAQPALDLMNQVYKSGCLKSKFLEWKFKSLKNVEPPQVANASEVYDRFIAGRPYALNLRWYKTYGSTVGYTYNWKDGLDAQRCYDKAGACPTETKIFSNSRTVSYYSPKDRAAHWAHELSHQARAGAFVHWTYHAGSGPYEIGNIFEACISSK